MFSSVSTSTSYRLRRAHLLVVIALDVVAMTACGISSSPRRRVGREPANPRLLRQGPHRLPPWSKSMAPGRAPQRQITDERMAAVTSIARQTAICAGQLRVIVFSSSSAGTSILFDGPLHLDGATERTPQARASSGGRGHGPRFGRRTACGGQAGPGPFDIAAQYWLAGEWIGQLGGTLRLHLYLLTDGFQNVGRSQWREGLSGAQRPSHWPTRSTCPSFRVRP